MAGPAGAARSEDASFRESLALYGQKNYKQSGRLLERLVREHPEKAKYWFNLGNVSLLSKKFDRAIECYEKGIIGPQDTGGLELSWGDSAMVVKLVEQMARREGFGAVLADGSRRAAERIGRGSEEFAMPPVRMMRSTCPSSTVAWAPISLAI